MRPITGKKRGSSGEDCIFTLKSEKNKVVTEYYFTLYFTLYLIKII